MADFLVFNNPSLGERANPKATLVLCCFFVVPFDLLRAFLRLPRFESTHFLASGFLTLCSSHLDKLGNQVGLIIPYINLGYNMVIPIARLKKIVARPLAARVKERSLR